MQLHDRNFTFYGAVEELEAKLIEQALELEGGSITRAAERLGLKRQTLSNMLVGRHRKLFDKRTPPVPRLKSIIRKDDGESPSEMAGARRVTRSPAGRVRLGRGPDSGHEAAGHLCDAGGLIFS